MISRSQAIQLRKLIKAQCIAEVRWACRSVYQTEIWPDLAKTLRIAKKRVDEYLNLMCVQGTQKEPQCTS